MEYRPAPLLSGGQQQRVALARALVYEPKMLLLDEPLSNLDAKLRTEMRLELKALVERLGLSTLYVTHDQIEALSMSDRIGVMHAGSIVQEGSARDIYLSPRSQFIATFIGSINVLRGQVLKKADNQDVGTVRSGGIELTCYLPKGVKKGDTVDIGVRPEAIEVSLERPQTQENLLEGVVEQSTFVGDALECKVLCGDTQFQVRTAGFIDLKRNERVFLYLPPARCVALSMSGEDAALSGSSSAQQQATSC
ncbi:MAG TPA: ABC transporter ATP-binding protein, partial [Candidatus Binatia bacterium]